jgi:hypothetical protein
MAQMAANEHKKVAAGPNLLKDSERGAMSPLGGATGPLRVVELAPWAKQIEEARAIALRRWKRRWRY